MNALILAAGKGSRLGPLTKELPKTLLKINNETLLSRLCKQLHSINIVNITIVIGFEQSKIIEETQYIQQITNQNFTFIMNDEYKQHEQAFLDLADKHGIMGIKGHRSVGGFRASTYNALPIESVAVLVQAMKDFEKSIS